MKKLKLEYKILLILFGLFLLGTCLYTIVFFSRNSAFRKAGLESAVKSAMCTEELTDMQIEEPWVLICIDETYFNKNDIKNTERWGIDGKSFFGPVTAGSLSKVNTVVLAVKNYHYAKYGSSKNSTGGRKGVSEGVEFYCINVRTGRFCKGQKSRTLVDEIVAKPLPYSSTDVPEYKVRTGKIRRYVRNHFEEW